MTRRFLELFPGRTPIIGVIALTPSPGYPAFTSIEAMLDAAHQDLAALERGGVAGVLLENDFDHPHSMVGTPEVIAAMTRVAREIVAVATVPVGVQVLLNDWRASLAIAAMTGARFIRLDFFVDRVRVKAGLVEPDPAAILSYQRAIGADHVLILADIQVKYSSLVDGPKPLAQSAQEAALAGADAVVVTSAETGVGPSTADLQAARGAGLPVLIGSGLSPVNAAALMPLADGAIVGTSLRPGRAPTDRADAGRVMALMAAVRQTNA